MVVYEKKVFIVDHLSDETHDDIRQYFVHKCLLEGMSIRNIWIHPVYEPVKIDERKLIIGKYEVALEIYKVESNERS